MNPKDSYKKEALNAQGLGKRNSNAQANTKRPSRPFSHASVQKLLDLSESTFKLNDIDMPPTERQLIEKFVDALAKLSAEISDDKKKRPEGLRRLHNALRAIEGWI